MEDQKIIKKYVIFAMNCKKCKQRIEIPILPGAGVIEEGEAYEIICFACGSKQTIKFKFMVTIQKTNKRNN